MRLFNLFSIIFFTFTTGCKTIEKVFSTIYLTTGVEYDKIQLTTKSSDRLGFNRFGEKVRNDFITRNQQDEPASLANLKRDVHSTSEITRGFFSLGSAPERYFTEYPVMKYFAFSFSLDSPRTFRGTLKGYPDQGISGLEPIGSYILNISPPVIQNIRKINYEYYDYRGYASFWVGYFESKFGYFAFGLNFGQVRYNFLIYENSYILSNVVGKYRPLRSQTLLFAFNLGRYFPKTLLEDTFIFFDITNESTFKSAVKTNVYRKDGGFVEPLYLSSDFVRFGIIKKVDLIRSED
ncbi:MAG: hypothetical protein KDK36_10470 [Leptospiraceae bacterium]|nr:hypothetical protein [Leptospiraceae bacterium]